MFYKKNNQITALERELDLLNGQIFELKRESDLFKKEISFCEKTFLNESVFKGFVDQKNIRVLSEIIKYLAIKEEKIKPAIHGHNEPYQVEKSEYKHGCHETVCWTETENKWVPEIPAIKYYSMNSKIKEIIDCMEKMDEKSMKEIDSIIMPLSIKEIKLALKDL